MRGPKDKWKLTRDALETLFVVTESIVDGYDPYREVVRKLQTARLAVAALAQHIDSAEECEKD